ncbi:sigma-54-dependent Fis family transcriptional regulator [bacterium]|nr:sigma-54-dependent Fis family transcriptional regulator [bacterium]
MTARILVIDDEENVRFTFRAFLEKEGHVVDTAEGYEDGLQKMKDSGFDLIFLDIMLGGQSGIDLLDTIRRQDHNVQIIMITGQPDIENAQASVRLGAFDYLTKPVLKETILNATGNALRHKQLLDEKEQIFTEKEQYRQNLETIFRSVTDGIISVNDRSRVIMINKSVRHICGFDTESAIGESLDAIKNPCSLTCLEVIRQCLQLKSPIREFRIECKHADREGKVVVLNASPLQNREGQNSGAVLVIRDITRLVTLEQSLKERYQFHNIIGKSKKMQEVYYLLSNLTHTETTVLITGESGTGKELIANALHFEGDRAFKPLIKVNCSALSESLLESELFGHVKGAFTGAIHNKKGRIELADGGTLLLDEIGDMSPNVQLKLLRVLQEREIERVGDSTPVPVDVRVLAATNCNLKAKVQAGAFREDLYYRLKVVEVHLPPLRERKEDIPLLIDRFCNHFSAKYHKHITGVSKTVMQHFMAYDWPGNVRELEHCIEHAFVVCYDQVIQGEHVPADCFGQDNMPPAGIDEPEQDEKIIILNVLEKTAGNKARAARLLGMSRQNLYRKLKFHHIDPSDTGR